MITDFLNDKGRVEIPSSRSKIVLMFLLSTAFFIGGIFFILSPSTFQSSYHYSPRWEILGIGYLTVAFFGLGVVLFPIQFVKNTPGLIIDNDGIIFNSPISSSSTIKWVDIDKFGVMSIGRTKLIMIYLKDPEAFVNQQANSIKRKLAAFNIKTYGTPASISTGTLKCNATELYNFLTDKLKDFK